jgi:hypothetical protein
MDLASTSVSDGKENCCAQEPHSSRALALILIPTAAVTVAAGPVDPPENEKCDFSGLDCAAKGKCKIHFENLTGLVENTCKKGASLASASTVKIRARDRFNKKV